MPCAAWQNNQNNKKEYENNCIIMKKKAYTEPDALVFRIEIDSLLCDSPTGGTEDFDTEIEGEW